MPRLVLPSPLPDTLDALDAMPERVHGRSYAAEVAMRRALSLPAPPTPAERKSAGGAAGRALQLAG